MEMAELMPRHLSQSCPFGGRLQYALSNFDSRSGSPFRLWEHHP
jgi:hypothetical protein